MSQRRGKKSATPIKDKAPETVAMASDTTETDLSSTKMKWLSPSHYLGMTPSQFCALLCISISSTQCLNLYRAVQLGEETRFCQLNYVHDNDSFLKCKPSDLSMLYLKYQTDILRIALCSLGSFLCWEQEDLLKSWNLANAIAPFGTQIAMLWTQRSVLEGKELIGLTSLAFLCITSSYFGRQGKTAIDLKEGMYNIVLLITSANVSSGITSMILEGPEAFLQVSGDKALTEGAKALFNLILAGDFFSLMFLPTCALFLFDAGRKRMLLFCMSVIALVHALYQLPLQREIWIDAPGRQSRSMILFFVYLLGALLPPFHRFVIKK